MIEELLSEEKQVFLSTYNRVPVEIERGEGVYLYDKDGTRYLDFFSGLAVNALGYAHPRIVEAVSAQIAKYAHMSNNYITKPQVELAKKLLAISGMGKVFLTNSGTESVEAAIKLIRLKMGSEKTIFSLTDGFHGRTYGALTLTARPKYQNGFEPLLPGISHIKFNDCDDLVEKGNKHTAAIVLEFLQGEGGVNEVSRKFVTLLESLRNKYGFILVSDCIQCGIGRTGKAFSHDYYGIKPDIIVVAKALGGGLPLGALLVAKHLEDVFTVGKHGTTFGGNPVCCAAGLIVLEEVFDNKLVDRVAELGDYLKEQLSTLTDKFPSVIKEVRGRGFMLGVELCFPGKPIVDELLKRGILANCTHETVLRLLPPLIMEKEQIDEFLGVFGKVISGYNSSVPAE